MEANGKKKGKGKAVLIILLAFVVVLNVLLVIFSGHVDLYLGRGEIVITEAEGTEDWVSEYYTNDYSTSQELAQAASDIVEEIAGEGFVLLKNNGTLPLSQKSKVTLLGRGAADPVYGGSGSGSVELDTVINLKAGLINAEFEINETVYSILEAYSLGEEGGENTSRADIVMDKPGDSSYYIGEMPVEYYTDGAIASFSEYNDAAIITISRPGGEGGDLSTDIEGWDKNYEQGQHQLELNYDEKQTIELAKENFENVIVVINSSSAMELGVLEYDDMVDAVIWVGSPGQTGFNALGDILNGTVNPSGRTADIYATDFTKDPTFVNFGNYQYSNINNKNANGNGYFVQYEEGIYFGYRYYETAAEEGFIDYEEAVVYSFGYGLSYTSFDWEVIDEKLGGVNGEIVVDVKVTNIGDCAGKDVVQLYYSAPYYDGGIEKAEVVLGDFVKTSLLEPGASEIVSLVFSVEEMASYDYKDAKAYVLEKGDYEILIQENSHSIKDGISPISYNVSQTIKYKGESHRASDRTEVTNQFDDVSAIFVDEATDGYALNMSRADFAGTFPTVPKKADMVASNEIIACFQEYVASENEDPNAVMPTTGADNSLSLIDLRGIDYNDDAWELLLDQINPEEIAALVLDGAYNSMAIESVAKPATVDLDGPAGLSAFMGDVHGTAFPSAVVISSTYNEDLIYEMGAMVGNEALENGVSGWYAPAMNLHRSPFAGRNFEYYSEDPVLSGKIGAACVSGASSKGVYSYIKHFALNDQETNRVNNGVATWANEQAIREIYLKPFEITVKTATATIKYIEDEIGTMAEKEMSGSTAVMSSFNRIGGTWAGGSYKLLQTVLRDEWGFEGVVVSDFNLYSHMYVNQGIMAGTDYNITFSSMKTIEDSTSATTVSDLRKSAHNLLYTVVNSNAMNGIVPGTTITYKMAAWKKVQIAVDILIVLVLLIWAFIAKKKKTAA